MIMIIIIILIILIITLSSSISSVISIIIISVRTTWQRHGRDQEVEADVAPGQSLFLS